MLLNVLRWAVIPVVLIASPLSGLSGGYEPLLNALVCLAAIILLLRAALLHRYVSGAGFIAIAVVFAPFFLALKVFLLLSLACVASFSAVLAGFRMRPAPAVCLVP
jgi:hypothetical protein